MDYARVGRNTVFQIGLLLRRCSRVVHAVFTSSFRRSSRRAARRSRSRFYSRFRQVAAARNRLLQLLAPSGRHTSKQRFARRLWILQNAGRASAALHWRHRCCRKEGVLWLDLPVWTSLILIRS